MAHSKKEAAQGRRIVVLRDVDAFLPTIWADAGAIQKASTAWAEIIETTGKSPGLCDVTAAITHEVYAALAEDLENERAIGTAIAEAMRSAAGAIIEDDHIRSEVEEFLCESDVAGLGPHTIVVEWTMMEAFNIVSDIRFSICEVGCIELVKIQATSPDTIMLAVSLPVAIFNAATAKHLEPGPHKSMADCVFDAIVDAKKLEPRGLSMFDEYEIPF